MAFKLGAKKKERELTIKDFQTNPIWIERSGDFGTVRPVISKNPNVTKELLDVGRLTSILCTAREVPKLLAQGWCDVKDRYLARPKFWQGGKWVEVKHL